MAIGLDDALLGWLVASAGDAVRRRLRDAPAMRAMRQVVEDAVDAAVAEVAGHLDEKQAEHLRSSLLIHDTGPGVHEVTVTSEAELRRALRAWTAALDRPEFGGPGYLGELDVHAHLLADSLTGHIVARVQRNGRSGGALDRHAEWLWRDGVAAPVEVLWSVIEGIGGETGWYSFPLAWSARGWLDRLVGGVGLRRGRRDPHRLRVGEALDFWRVEEIEPGRLLRLRAEMRLPGRAWLQMRAVPGDGGSRYEQRALFLPKGLAGHLYWKAVAPMHTVVFGGMADNIARTAERLSRHAPLSSRTRS